MLSIEPPRTPCHDFDDGEWSDSEFFLVDSLASEQDESEDRQMNSRPTLVLDNSSVVRGGSSLKAPAAALNSWVDLNGSSSPVLQLSQEDSTGETLSCNSAASEDPRCHSYKLLTKHSYDDPDVEVWARRTLSEHARNKTVLDVKKTNFGYVQVQAGRVPRTVEDLDKCAWIQCNSPNPTVREKKSTSDFYVDLPGQLGVNCFLVDKEVNLEPAPELSSVEFPGAASSALRPCRLVRLWTGWKPNKGAKELETSKPEDVSVWCYFLVSNDTANLIQAKTRGLKKEDFGASLFVPLPNTLSPTVTTLPNTLSPTVTTSAAATGRSLGDVSEMLVDHLIQTQGFCSESQDHGQRADLKREMLVDLEEVVKRRKEEQPRRWPDFVFEEGFILPSIASIFRLAMQNKHFPGVVSEQKIKDGDFDAFREIKSILFYVEVQFLHLKRHDDKLQQHDDKLQELQAALDEQNEARRQNLFDGIWRRHTSTDTFQSSMKEWETKFQFPLYSHQTEAVKVCLEKNTIVSLEPGCGKTLIAVKVIDEYLKSKPEQHALFLVPTTVLVTQQAAKVRAHSEVLLPSSSYQHEGEHFIGGVEELCGMKMESWDQQQWDACLRRSRVLVGTPEVFNRAMIRTRFLAADCFSVIVFDECHNATGRAPMAVIMREAVARLELHNRPRIVGLTASILNGAVEERTVVKKREELERTLESTVWTPASTKSTTKERKYHDVGWEPDYFDDTHTAKRVYTEFTCCHVTSILKPLAKLIKQKNIDKICFDAHCVLCELGKKAFFCYLEDGVVQELTAKANQMLSNEKVRPWAERFLRELPAIKQQIRAAASRQNTQPCGEPEKGVGPLPVLPEESSKARKLLELLRKLRNQDPSARILVFCERVCMGFPMAQLLSQAALGSDHRPLRVGHVSGVMGMVEAHRRETILQFENGTIDLIVATCAMEEGVDVAQCRFVVRFSRFHTAKSHIQGSGRTRSNNAEIFYFNNEVAGEQRRAALLDATTRNPALALPNELLHADPNARVVGGRHPFVAQSGARVVLCHCLQILLEYVQQVLKADVRPEDLFEDALSAPLHWRGVAGADSRPPRMVAVYFPDIGGYARVTEEEVAGYWGVTTLQEVMHEEELRKLPPRRCDQLRFAFVAVVELHRRALLDANNNPSPFALERCRLACSTPPKRGQITIHPRFRGVRVELLPPSATLAQAASQHSLPIPSKQDAEILSRHAVGTSAPRLGAESAGGSSTLPLHGACLSASSEGNGGVLTVSDFKSVLNVQTSALWRGSVDTVRYETRSVGCGQFSSQVLIVPVQARFQGEVCPRKKEAEQSAAKAALANQGWQARV